MKARPELAEEMSYEESGERFSMHYLRPAGQEDLRRRSRAHQRIADYTFGIMGRTPDTVASNITGLSMAPEVFETEGGNGSNVEAIWQHLRRNDMYCTYAIVLRRARAQRNTTRAVFANRR